MTRQTIGQSRHRRAFTLVEALVAVVLVTIGLVAVFGGIAALHRADVRAHETELLQRLALQKINEIGKVTDPLTADTSGDFSDRGFADITWKLDIQPSGADNVDTIALTASRGDNEQTLIMMLYIPPATSSTGAATP